MPNLSTVMRLDNARPNHVYRVEQLEAKLKRLDVEMLTIDDEGNPVGCGMDLLDWQAQLQTELGVCRMKNAALKRLLRKHRQLIAGYGAGSERNLPELDALLKAKESE